MKNKLIKAVRTIADFDLNLFNELNLGLELQDFTEPCLTDSEIYSLLNEYEKKRRPASSKIKPRLGTCPNFRRKNRKLVFQ